MHAPRFGRYGIPPTQHTHTAAVKDKETCLAACKANDQWTGEAAHVAVEFGDIFKRCECGSKHKTYT